MDLRAFLAAVALLGAMTGVACGGDDEPAATPTTEAVATATQTAVESEPSPTTAPTSSPTEAPSPRATETPEAGDGEGDIDEGAIWEPALGLDRLMQACPDKIDGACLAALAEAEKQDGAPAEAIVFFEAYEAFLYQFEEQGAVDFGAVISPLYNMGRPEPVFLNGDFGVLYVGEVIPQDWQTEPSYTEMGDAITWQEYSGLVEASTSGETQVFALEIPIQECRACETLGYLNVEVSFEAGALLGAEVLPLTETPATPAP